MQPGESHVLGVADSGARVTAAQRPGRRPEGFDFGEARPQPVPLVFRDARGEVLATREPEILPGTSPAVRGDEAYYVRRVGGDYVLFRTSAAEAETALLKMPADRVRRETGRVDEVSLHATSAGLVLELRGGPSGRSTTPRSGPASSSRRMPS